MTTNSSGLLDLADDIGRAAAGLGQVVNGTPWLTGAYGQFCRVFSGTPGGQVGQLLDIPNVCTPYWDDDGIAPPTTEPGIQGGQCQGEVYNFDVDFILDGNPIRTENYTAVGAISRERFTTQPGGPGVRLLDGNGNLVGAGATVPAQIESGNPDATANLVTRNMVRTDGMPDDCGNGPDEFIPSPDYPGTQFGDPFEYNDPNGRPWSINVGPPEFNDNGDLIIPIDVNGNPVNIGVPDSSGGGGGGLNPGPVTPGEDIEGGDGDGEEDVPPGENGTRCVAIALVVASVPSGSGIVPSTMPNNRYRAVLGNISVKVVLDGGGEYYQRDVLIQTDRTIEAIAVEGLTITGFRVNLLPGMSYTATPLYRSETTEQEA